MKKYQMRFIFLFIILLLAACDEAALGSEETKSETITVAVFIDKNVNGRFDPNEPPIPDTLIVVQYNSHGDFTRTAVLTDADGSVALSADYTHFFDVAVVPPCGFEATTAVKLSVQDAEDEVGAFGFRPETTGLGVAEIQVQLWQDDYEDGTMGDGERPLTTTTIHFNPDLAWFNSSDQYTGLLSAQTDENGIATTSFGNGCGVVWIEPLVESRFTKIRPAAIYEEGQVGFEYAAGLLEVRMGVTDSEIETEFASVVPTQFTFANGSPNHPEGLGEWQLLLDSGGYFTLKHIIGEEETDYGVTTLLPGENERLWQLIDAADLSAIPSSAGEAVPDTVIYTFTLITGDDAQTLTIWSTEAQENETIQDLLNGLTEVIKSHTGEDIVLRGRIKDLGEKINTTSI